MTLTEIKDAMHTFDSPDAAACTLFDDLLNAAERLQADATYLETRIADLERALAEANARTQGVGP